MTVFMVLACHGAVLAQNSVFYIPLPETQFLASLEAIDASGGSDPISPVTSLISISVGTNPTQIYYDHWEDGYGTNVELWGDGYAINGCVPNRNGVPIPCTDAEDYLPEGVVVVLENDVPIPRNSGDILYDGGDRVESVREVSLTRFAYADGTGSLLAGAVTVSKQARWAGVYTSPVGIDTPDQNSMFDYTALYVMAAADGTQVSLNGTTVATLAQGGSYIITDVEEGDEVTTQDAAHPVQVHLLTGDVGSTWELRLFNLVPLNLLANNYYTPVGTVDKGSGDGCTNVWLYNSNATDITVNWELGNGETGALTVPGNSSRRGPGLDFADEFGISSYSNNDGASNWSGSWVEARDLTTAPIYQTGRIQIVGGELRFTDGSDSPYIYRVANLQGMAGATLTFDIRHTNAESTDSVQIWANDGGGWGTVGDAIPGGFSGTQQITRDVSGYISSTTTIAIQVDTNNTSEYFFIDNVVLEAYGYIPDDEGARFYSGGDNFDALSVTDCEGDQIYDWGYPVIPEDQLTTQVLVGGAPGCTNSDCGGAGEDIRSPVWVTAVAATTIYVDYNFNANGYTCDNLPPPANRFAVDPLKSIKLEDTGDNAMTGALIFTCDDTKIAAAWGQDPDKSFSGDQNGLDMGTAVLPLESFPTLAAIESFTAYEDMGQTVVEWVTSAEIGTVGFYLHRLDPATGRYERVNTQMLSGLVANPFGGTYRYVQEGVPAQGVYKLVEVDARGRKRVYGPFRVAAADVGAANEGTTFAMAPDAGLFSAGAMAKAQRRKHKEGKNYERKARKMSARMKFRLEDAGAEVMTAKAYRETLAGTAVKVAVDDDGLYYLDASEIAQALGQKTRNIKKWIRTETLALSTGGRDVAYMPARGNRGIYFVGAGIDSIFTNERIYWLKRSPGSVMEKVPARPPRRVPPAAETFTETVRMEKDTWAELLLFDDPMDDYWLWDYVYLDGSDPEIKESAEFQFATPARTLTDSPSRLVLRLQGGMEVTDGPENHAEVFVNGEKVGAALWNGIDAHELEITFDDDLLTDGDNTLTVKGILDPGVPFDFFYIDSFEVTYQRAYTAAEGELLFQAPGPDKAVVTIGGFTDPGIHVFDISDYNRPRLLKRVKLEDTDGDYRVSFLSQPGARYLATAPTGVRLPLSIVGDQAADLADPSNAAEYLVIAPAVLMEGAQELADYRRFRGLTTLVADLEDVMDEFNYGIYDPMAIRTFISHAYHNWQEPPRYVVLVGDGTYDYRDLLGYGNNLMPPVMVGSPYGLVPTDSRYVDVDGEGVAKLAIGRLPVLTSLELRDVLAKISAYETNTNPAIYLAADNNDPDAGNFTEDSDHLYALLPPALQAVTEKIYLPVLGMAAARSRISHALDTGALLLNYIGHGGLRSISSYDSGTYMLTHPDLDSLSDDVLKPPVVAAMTCNVGRFSGPTIETLSEGLVLREGGGAVAVWSSSGDSLNTPAVYLDEGFFIALFKEDQKTLGNAILSAVQRYAKSSYPRFELDLFNLLGDPALEMAPAAP